MMMGHAKFKRDYLLLHIHICNLKTLQYLS